MKEEDKLACPCCGNKNGLSILFHASTVLRVSVEDGIAILRDELLREPKLVGTKVVARYSSLKGDTRITVFKDEAKVEIDCPKCFKVYNLPEDIAIECKGAR